MATDESKYKELVEVLREQTIELRRIADTGERIMQLLPGWDTRNGAGRGPDDVETEPPFAGWGAEPLRLLPKD